MQARPATESELDRFRSLRHAAVAEGSFIGDGERVVKRMLQLGRATTVLGLERRIASLEIPAGVEVLLASEKQLMDIVGYRLHAGLMAEGTIPAEKPIAGTLHVALDELANAENVGAIMRTCAAFGVDGVIIGPGTTSPWHRRAVRVSMGAPLIVPVHTVANLADTMRGMNAWAAHIHGDKKDFLSIDMRVPICLVLGSEDRGVTDPVIAASKGIVYIPMAEKWDCLNVAASTAVLLGEAARQRR